ncbi:hypothetical protein Pen02_12170 [Plantactinospora endophytica]|uniref:Carrier domain-containing protein n=1 Tax=Plantactinospora endophytica TaxID=673535 RepID=A0ABQ4DW43_9ACTN|nr:hypothetical protein Pen02_12170 [Plantactinospora endophytica]
MDRPGPVTGEDLVALVVSAFRTHLPAEEPVDADTDFFDAGGNSVTAARVVARLRHELDVRLSIRDMFGNPTARSLAERLGRLSESATPDPGRRARRPADGRSITR